VLGDPEKLAPHLRQLILNPCAGHPKRARSLQTTEIIETMRELAALDGAFVVSASGVVESAGTYLDAPGGGVQLPSGFGARHAAAAAITVEGNALAIVLSESSGRVTLFHRGQIVLQLYGESGRRRILLGRRKSRASASRRSVRSDGR
jgi:DNA integrity scanning protein DisA with diadenylate cyclase activity